MLNSQVFDTFDTLPVVNWYLLNKHDDLMYLINDNCTQKIKNEILQKAYEKLIESEGGRELINGFYLKTLKHFLLFLFDKNPINEQKFNDSFYDYLRKINNQLEYFEFDNKKYQSIEDAYTDYFKKNGYDFCLENRVYDFNIFDLRFKKSEYNLFDDVSAIESILNISINPKNVSVSHFEALKRQAKQKIKNMKNG